MTMTSGEELIETIVERVWRNEVGLPPTMSPAEQKEFLAEQTRQVEARMDELMPDTIEVQASYRRQTGEQPDFLTTVGLMNNGRMQARQIALSEELFSLVAPEDDESEPELTFEETRELRDRQTQDAAQQLAQTRAAHQGDPDRWTNPLHCNEPEPQIEELADQMWADRTAWFRVLAARLLQVRSEDAMTVPTVPSGAVFRLCTSLVETQLVAAGRPLDARAPR